MKFTDGERTDARDVITRALAEDLRYGPDVTTQATVAADATTSASVVARESGVLAGSELALMVLDAVLGDDGYRVVYCAPDGTRLAAGDAALTVQAPTQGLLTAERTLLNLVCHLSGVATTTAAWVEAVAGTSAQIRDSRISLPGLRGLQ